jgi:hypothetical protein
VTARRADKFRERTRLACWFRRLAETNFNLCVGSGFTLFRSLNNTSLMRIVPLVVAILLLPLAAFAGEIRQFKIRTLEKLGNEISRRDEIAAKASDVVLETQAAAKALKLVGWITELGKAKDKVYLVAETASGPCLAYTVSFAGSEKPVVEDRRGQALPPNIALRYKARGAAAAAVKDHLYDVPYNFEVLDDPDGRGFLVYALAATKKDDEILTGGHYRVTVAADGSRAEQVDLLSQLIRQPKGDADHKTVAVSASQLSSNVPVETWLYSSHLYHMPMFVAGKDGSIWGVVNGRIVRADAKGPKNHLDILNGKAPQTYPDEKE